MSQQMFDLVHSDRVTNLTISDAYARLLCSNRHVKRTKTENQI